MFSPRSAFGTARDYFKRHPEEIGRAVRSAFGLRVGVPLDALRWLATEVERSGKVRSLAVEAVPPGIRVAAELDLMKTPLRAAADVYIDRVRLDTEEMTITVRLENVKLDVAGPVVTPVAALIRSGALDLKNPGNLAAHLPGLPPIVREAKDNRIVLDLMRDPRLAQSELARRIVGVLSSLVTVHGVESDTGHVDVSLRALPRGFRGAATALQRHLVAPSLRMLVAPRD